jgi:hypothetical protein
MYKLHYNAPFRTARPHHRAVWNAARPASQMRRSLSLNHIYELDNIEHLPRPAPAPAPQTQRLGAESSAARLPSRRYSNSTPCIGLV